MFMMTVPLDPGSRVPLYQQLYRFIRGEILAGRLVPGERLPSKRGLCASLGVSQSTVETAYELLLAEGFLRTRPRSGFYVEDVVLADAGAAAQREAAPQAARRAAEGPFSTGAVDVSLFPSATWAKLYREALCDSPALLQRGERQGEFGLRRTLAGTLSELRGVRCAPEQIVVGAGIESLLDSLITLLGQKAVWALEDPGYGVFAQALALRGRQTRFMPLDEDGMDAAALEQSDADVAILTPSHQFPMGITVPAARRSRLLRWAAAREDRWILEDDYDSEFRYGTRPIPSMQGMDTADRVIYLGTFSRSLAPAIRLAYMVLPPSLLTRYRALYLDRQTTVSRCEQAAMERFLTGGAYARYLRRVGKRYAAKREVLLSVLGSIPGAKISGADGGMHFLLTLPGRSEEALLRMAAEAGIPLQGIRDYCHTVTPPPSTLVLGYGGVPLEQVRPLAERLRGAFDS